MNTPRNHLYTASELAEAFGTTARALRFYESKGLLDPRRAGARRVYDYRDRARLQLVLRGKNLGFTLAQIKEYLALYDADPKHHEQIHRLRALVAERIADLEQRYAAIKTALAELRAIAAEVETAIEERDDVPIGARDGRPTSIDTKEFQV